MRTDVTMIVHVNGGTRSIDMPGARRVIAVDRKFTAPKIEATPVSIRPTIQRSVPVVVEYGSVEVGGEPVQPMSAAPDATRKPEKMIRPPKRNSQYDSAFRRGKTMSAAPTWSGTR